MENDKGRISHDEKSSGEHTATSSKRGISDLG